jgi:nitroimidazol reductase NimA-like FMN-containing flavoprotein (pyridoxamine 5'-phosphate oxidase superfamily)
MSRAPEVRRKDKLMPEEAARALLGRGYVGRVATADAHGQPYITPLLYVLMDGRIYVHNSRARGHFRQNVDANARVCFEVDEPGAIFAYGRFECDSSIAYDSVVVFGSIAVVDDAATKQRFCEELMRKYAPASGRPEGFFPRIDQITVYAIDIERMTGKTTPLPAEEDRWPASDHTRSPDAVTP